MYDFIYMKLHLCERRQTQNNILYDNIYMKFLKNPEVQKQKANEWVWGRSRVHLQMGTRKIFGGNESFLKLNYEVWTPV